MKRTSDVMNKLTAHAAIAAAFAIACAAMAEDILVAGKPNPAYSALEVWLDAGAEVYTDAACTAPAADGDKVRGWKNLSTVAGKGSNALQRSGWDTPVYHNSGAALINGKPVVSFDYQDVLEGSLSITTDKTFIAVFRDTNSTGNGWIIGTRTVEQALGVKTTSGHKAWLDRNGYEGIIGTSSVQNTATAATGIYDHTNQRGGGAHKGYLWVAGRLENSGDINEATGSTYDLGVRNGGAYGADATLSYQGDTAEVLVYNGVLSDSDRHMLDAYLMSKYGIAIQGASKIINSSATNITENSAWMNGYLTSTDGVPTFVRLYWGDNDGQDTNDNWDGTNHFGQLPEGPLTTNMTGLASNTTYWYRFHASNSVLANWASPSASFATRGAPSVSNTAASAVAGNAACINGNLTSTGGAPTFVWAYWGDNDGQDTNDSWDGVGYLGQRAEGALSLNITGLATNTTYYYRYHASNSFGVGWAGPSGSFTTKSAIVRQSLQIWFDAADIVSGNSWTSRAAGHGNAQVLTRDTGGFAYDAAYLNGYPAVVNSVDSNRFTGSGADTNWNFAGSGTWFGVGKQTDAGLNPFMYKDAYMWDFGATNMTPRFWGGATAGAGLGAKLGAAGAVPTGEVFILEVRYTNSAVAFYVNGVPAGTNAFSGPMGNTTNSVNLGMLNNSQSFMGGIGEILLYHEALGDVERSTVGYYLQNKYGIAGSYTDPNGPIVNNDGGPANITATSADFRGTLVSTGNTPTEVWVYWGTNDGATVKTDWQHETSFGVMPAGPLTANITGMDPAEWYYYRYYASNSAGAYWPFTTEYFGPPAVDNDGGASSIQSYSAALNGTLTSVGNLPTQAWVCWGETSGGTNRAGWTGGYNFGVSSTGAKQRILTGLQPQRWYAYRYYASNAHAEVWAPAENSFWTTKKKLWEDPSLQAWFNAADMESGNSWTSRVPGHGNPQVLTRAGGFAYDAAYLNGNPAVVNSVDSNRFTGSGADTNWNFAGSGTWFGVGKQTDAGLNPFMYKDAYMWDFAATNMTPRFWGGATAGAGLGAKLGAAGAVPTGEVFILEVRYTNSAVAFYVNGVPAGTNAFSGPMGNTTNSVNLGMLNNSQSFMGGIGEILMYHAALDELQRNDTGWYLQTKYGISGGYLPLSDEGSLIILH